MRLKYRSRTHFAIFCLLRISNIKYSWNTGGTLAKPTDYERKHESRRRWFRNWEETGSTGNECVDLVLNQSLIQYQLQFGPKDQGRILRRMRSLGGTFSPKDFKGIRNYHKHLAQLCEFGLAEKVSRGRYRSRCA